MVCVFNSMPTDPLFGRTMEMRHGVGLGGSTLMNAGLYSRPAQSEFDSYWPALWNSETTLKYFKRFENYLADTNLPENHGTGGPVTVTASSLQMLGKAWLDRAVESGVGRIVDGGSGEDNVTGVYQVYPASLN
jgi:choline dehydrogenase